MGAAGSSSDAASLAPQPKRTPDTGKLDESALEQRRVLIQDTLDMTLAKPDAWFESSVNVTASVFAFPMATRERTPLHCR